jgi:hypothetical protein
MLKEIKQFFDFLVSPRLYTLNNKELNHQYNKHRVMKYLFTAGSFLVFMLCINAMFQMLITMNNLNTVEIQFYTGLTVFTVFVIAGLMISSELKLESTMKYIIRNQIDIITMIKKQQHKCENEHEKKRVYETTQEILEEKT